LLVQDSGDTDAPPPAPACKLVWDGARPGDRSELYHPYRRAVANQVRSTYCNIERARYAWPRAHIHSMCEHGDR